MRRKNFNLEKVLESQILEGNCVLDIGCWGGERVLKLGNKCDIYGFDINPSRFNLAPKSIRDRLIFGDVTKKIPFKNKFDWVFCTEVLEHVSDDEVALKNISKSLKDGGKLILSTPKYVKGFNIWDPAWVRWKILMGQKHYHYKKKELFEKLKKYHLIPQETYVGGNLTWVFKRWINVFLRYLLKTKKQLKNPMIGGFCDWIIIAKKTNPSTK